jgi:DNA-binding transcriptional LysR family regulator
MQRPTLDPDKLRLLLEVAQRGSLSSVALAEHTSQSHISKVIAQMEAQWGDRLFRRTGRGMALTEFGQAVLPRVRNWLDEAQRMDDDFRGLAGAAAGEVRLAVLPAFSSPSMVLLFGKVRARYPALRLRIFEAHMEQIDGWLQAGQVDVAVTLRYVDQVPDGRSPLVRLPLMLCGRPGDPLLAAPHLPFAALDGLPLVLHTRPGLMHEHLTRLFAQRGMRLVTVAEASSVGVQRDIAATGSGYALLSELAVEAPVRERRLAAVRVVDPSLMLHLDLALPAHGPVTAATRAVVASLRETVAELRADGRLRDPAP